VIIQAGCTILRKEYLPFFEVQNAIKNKANQDVIDGISLHASLSTLLSGKTSSCESRGFARAEEQIQQKGALSLEI